MSKLQVLRQANIDFYQDVRRIIGRQVVIVHRKNGRNLGDFSTNPALYFDLPVVDVVEITDRLTIDYHLANGRDFIIGGGGLLCLDSWQETIGDIIDKARKTIVWSIGKNRNPNHQGPHYPDFLQRAALVGIRDYDQDSYRIVPCPSCMSPVFDNPPEPVEAVSFYSHKQHKIFINSKTTGDFQTMEECIKHLARGKTVATSSYHGAYWGICLGRRLEIRRMFSNKFRGLPF